MTEHPRGRLFAPVRRLLSTVGGPRDGTETPAGTNSYFCRACGTTFETHVATCPDCGSNMLEPTHDHA
jgi:rubrerythrin